MNFNCSFCDGQIGSDRCREVRDQEFKSPTLKIRKYFASGAYEYFLSFETPDEKILYGFLRLRLPVKNSNCLPELYNCALIRELHVYGKLKEVWKKNDSNSKNGPLESDIRSSQHQGLGSQLLAKAESIAIENGKIAYLLKFFSIMIQFMNCFVHNHIYKCVCVTFFQHFL